MAITVKNEPVENSSPAKIIVIVGPNASGKTALSIKIAKQFGGEIVSADSRQIYKGLDIGTGKATKKEMRGIPHHLLDVASPRSRFTVARYQKLAAKAIKDILKRGKLPIVCGGTGLYVNSILYGNYFPPVPPESSLRTKLDKKTAPELFTQLEKLDPVRAANIDRYNKVRLVRALEIVLQTGSPIPKISGQKKIYDALEIGVKMPDDKLRSLIHKRLLKRMKTGMLAEAKKLHASGLSFKRMEELGLEYRYLARYLQNKISKEEMLQELEKEIWRYSRRQMTWFRKDKDIKWTGNEKEVFELVKKFLGSE